MLLANKKKFEILAEEIQKMIVDSKLVVGDRLPPVNELCQLFEVTPVTLCNAINLLKERKIIKSISRKGNFLKTLPQQTPEFSLDDLDFLESLNPLTTSFNADKKTLYLYLDEYKVPSRQKLWDMIIAEYENRNIGVKIHVVSDDELKGNADIILFSSSFFNEPLLELDDEANIEFHNDLDETCFYPVVCNDLKKLKQKAALPFAINAEMMIWNKELVEKFCPGIISDSPDHVITYIKENYDYRKKSFPVVGTFLHFSPFVLMKEGIDIYDQETGKLDFSDERIAGILDFNKYMLDKFLSKFSHFDDDIYNKRLIKAFLNGEILGFDSFSSTIPFVQNHSFRLYTQITALKKWSASASVLQILGVSTRCKDTVPAMEFVKFACSEQAQKMLARSCCNIPVLKHVAETDFVKASNDINMNSVIKTLSYSKSVLTDVPVCNQRIFGHVGDITLDFYNGKNDLSTTIKLLNSLS